VPSRRGPIPTTRAPCEARQRTCVPQASSRGPSARRGARAPRRGARRDDAAGKTEADEGRFAPDPRQFDRESSSFRRFQAVPHRVSHPRSSLLAPGQHHQKRLGSPRPAPLVAAAFAAVVLFDGTGDRFFGRLGPGGEHVVLKVPVVALGRADVPVPQLLLHVPQ
jgi:hypothetical protein